MKEKKKKKKKNLHRLRNGGIWLKLQEKIKKQVEKTEYNILYII